MKNPKTGRKWCAAELICVIAGAVAAIGTVLTFAHISPLYVGVREATLNLMSNHAVCYTPFILACWIAWKSARYKSLCTLPAFICTIIYILGFLVVFP